jgi:hypothetical protein
MASYAFQAQTLSQEGPFSPIASKRLLLRLIDRELYLLRRLRRRSRDHEQQATIGC